MRIAEIARITEVKEPTVYDFAYRNKVPREKRQGERGVYIDLDAYITALEAKRFKTEAARLRSYLGEEDAS